MPEERMVSESQGRRQARVIRNQEPSKKETMRRNRSIREMHLFFHLFYAFETIPKRVGTSCTDDPLTRGRVRGITKRISSLVPEQEKDPTTKQNLLSFHAMQDLSDEEEK